MLNQVAALLQLRDLFGSDAEYMEYCEQHVIPPLAKLVKAVGQDLLWKPLNHKVLMMTRDNRKALKLVGLKTLHRLFAEVFVYTHYYVNQHVNCIRLAKNILCCCRNACRSSQNF